MLKGFSSCCEAFSREALGHFLRSVLLYTFSFQGISHRRISFRFLNHCLHAKTRACF
jgi:hypothetical protein